MKLLLKFFDYLFKWKIGVVVQIAVVLFVGLHYKIESSYIALFIFVGVICYSGAALLGLGIIYSWIGVFKKDGRKFIAIYLPLLIFECMRCSLELHTAYVHHKNDDIFVSWTYTSAFTYAVIGLMYYLATPRVNKRSIKIFNGKKLVNEKSDVVENEA